MIFLDFFSRGESIQSEIAKLIEARRMVQLIGVHGRTWVDRFEEGLYAAYIDDREIYDCEGKIALKLVSSRKKNEWEPCGKNWQLWAEGEGYVVWIQSDAAVYRE